MGKFSAAKSSDATDKRLQAALNYLITLLETGYVAEGLVGEHRVRVDLNSQQGLVMVVDDEQVIGMDPLTGVLSLVGGIEVRCSALNALAVMNAEKIGFYDLTTDEFIGGLANVNGEIALIAKILANNEHPDFYAEIGDVMIGDHDWDGLFGFLAEDTTTPVYSILGGVSPSGWAAGNYGIFRSKNGYSFMSVYDYDDVGSSSLYGANSDDEWGELTTGPYGLAFNSENNTKNAYFSVDGSGTWHGQDQDMSWQIPIEFWGKATGVSSSAWTSVNFPYPYFPTGADVHVLLSVETETAGVIAPKFRNVSTSGFEVTIGGSGFSEITVHWRAFASQ